jgi:glycosyltransferase involved in cell wall biosynthesis
MTKTNPLISICMPSYNQADFIREAIDSALNQTYQNIELIILDSKSSDGSVDIIKSYNDPRIRFYPNNENEGCYGNCNKLISLAKGELIAFLHTDDFYAPTFLEEIVKAYRENPDKKVFLCIMCKVDMGLNSVIPCCPFKSSGVKSQKEVLISLAFDNTIGNGMSVVVHKDCFREVGVFDNNQFRYSADYDMFMRLANKYEFVYIHKPLAFYRLHSANLTNSVYLEMIKQGHKICNKNFKDSGIISKDLQKQLLANQWDSMILKAYYIGLKYRSKKLTEDLIEFYCETYPEFSHKRNRFSYLMPLLDLALKSNFTNSITAFLLRLGKLYKTQVSGNTQKILIKAN